MPRLPPNPEPAGLHEMPGRKTPGPYPSLASKETEGKAGDKMELENWNGFMTYFLMFFILWGAGALWALHRTERARRLVKEAESRKARARERYRDYSRLGGYGYRSADAARGSCRRAMR